MMFNAISSGVHVDPETGDATFHLDSEDGEVFEFVMDQDAVEGALLESVKFAINQRNLPVRAAKYRALNADLILECVQMGYLKHEWKTVDLTYGDGKWWTKWEPDHFVKHDKFKGDGVDYTCLPEADETYDVVAYDPTYVNPGLPRRTAGRGTRQRRYPHPTTNHRKIPAPNRWSPEAYPQGWSLIS